MEIRLLRADEVQRLAPYITALAAIHNAIPSDFAGIYPLLPVEHLLENVAGAVREGRSRIEVVEEDGEIVAFCKVSCEKDYGTLDYLFVRAASRGRGYGKLLMDRAMDFFAAKGARLVDLKVVAGNPAELFYEQYGFQVRTHVMTRKV